MKGRPRRGLASRMRRARSSLPVPLSPWIRTGTLLRATRVALATRSRMAGEQAINCRTSPEEGSPSEIRSGTPGSSAGMGVAFSVVAVCLEHPAVLDELVDFRHESTLTRLEVGQGTIDAGSQRLNSFSNPLQQRRQLRAGALAG